MQYVVLLSLSLLVLLQEDSLLHLVTILCLSIRDAVGSSNIVGDISSSFHFMK